MARTLFGHSNPLSFRCHLPMQEPPNLQDVYCLNPETRAVFRSRLSSTSSPQV